MATGKRPAIGRDVTLVKLWGCTISGSTISVVTGSALDLTTRKTGLNMSIDPITEEINGDSSLVANNVLLADDRNLKLDILLVNDGTDTDPLYTLIETYTYIKAQVTIGTGTSARSRSSIYIRGSLNIDSTGRGRIVATLNLLGTDTDAWNVTETP